MAAGGAPPSTRMPSMDVASSGGKRLLLPVLPPVLPPALPPDIVVMIGGPAI